jgi:hypothetical protein
VATTGAGAPERYQVKSRAQKPDGQKMKKPIRQKADNQKADILLIFLH